MACYQIKMGPEANESQWPQESENISYTDFLKRNNGTSNLEGPFKKSKSSEKFRQNGAALKSLFMSVNIMLPSSKHNYLTVQ